MYTNKLYTLHPCYIQTKNTANSEGHVQVMCAACSDAVSQCRKAQKEIKEKKKKVINHPKPLGGSCSTQQNTQIDGFLRAHLAASDVNKQRF